MWVPFMVAGVQVGEAGASAGTDAKGAQWTKWFGGGGSSASEGKIKRVHRKGCAVVACYGQRLKNMIGPDFFERWFANCACLLLV